MQKKSNKKSSNFPKMGKNVGSLCTKWEKSKVAFILKLTLIHMVTWQIRILSYIYNRTTSHFEAHLIYKHTQKPIFLISNER